MNASNAVPDFQPLVTLLDEAYLLLSRGGNDFIWSSWEDADHALGEIRRIQNQLRAGDSAARGAVTFIFLPTGPMQEVSLSSGWAEEFIDLANRVDAALAASDCACMKSPRADLVLSRSLGMDDQLAEISVRTCPDCGQVWLHYLLESEGFTRGGSWWLCPLSASEVAQLRTESARAILDSKTFRYEGGSYFDRPNT